MRDPSNSNKNQDTTADVVDQDVPRQDHVPLWHTVFLSQKRPGGLVNVLPPLTGVGVAQHPVRASTGDGLAAERALTIQWDPLCALAFRFGLLPRHWAAWRRCVVHFWLQRFGCAMVCGLFQTGVRGREDLVP